MLNRIFNLDPLERLRCLQSLAALGYSYLYNSSVMNIPEVREVALREWGFDYPKCEKYNSEKISEILAEIDRVTTVINSQKNNFFKFDDNKRTNPKITRMKSEPSRKFKLHPTSEFSLETHLIF
jgi:hypothetical protein